MIYSRSNYSSLPTKAGVYRFLDSGNEVIYAGKANDLRARVSSYFVNRDLGEKTRILVSQIKKINVTIVESELEALLLEAFYIKKFRPKYNISLKDNKSFIRIKIAIKDKYPGITLVRRDKDLNSIYFGPYPSAGSVRLVLKTIRRIFPYVSVRNHPKRICLYNHLGLCPCPGVNDSPDGEKAYKKNIRNIIRILEGGSKKIMRELEKERDKLSRSENYEEASEVQRKINALSLITTPYHKPFEYDLNPNLRVDLRQRELKGLMDVLNEANEIPPSLPLEKGGVTLSAVTNRSETPSEISPNPSLEKRGDASALPFTKKGAFPPLLKEGQGGFYGGVNLVTKLNRIECYDISNTQGTNPTASMVVLTNGEIDKSQYRKFKIKIKGPNDFAMMEEVLKRRFKHIEWEYPDLVIVDGGKGQVSSALKVLSLLNIQIPVIGLAKREEMIILPEGERVKGEGVSQYTEISLPKNSPSLHLIMRIRDEAHRFAINYHKKLRSKNLLRN